MPNQDPQIEATNIKKLAKMLDSKQLLDTEDLKGFIADIVTTFTRFIAQHKAVVGENKDAVSTALMMMKDAHDELLSTVDLKGDSITADFQKKLDDAITKFSAKVNEMASMLPEDGKDADEQAIIDKLHELLQKNIVEETPVSLRDKLETLGGDERLDKSAVKGIDEWMAQIQGVIQQMTFKRGGNTNGGGVQSIISTDGTVTITSSMAKGKGVIDLSVTVSGSYSLLTATGAVDDTNTAFSFISKPTEIVKNGISYRENHGWTWDIPTLTATLTTGAVGTDGDIYGRK
jgi:hypothetical protein